MTVRWNQISPLATVQICFVTQTRPTKMFSQLSFHYVFEVISTFEYFTLLRNQTVTKKSFTKIPRKTGNGSFCKLPLTTGVRRKCYDTGDRESSCSIVQVACLILPKYQQVQRKKQTNKQTNKKTEKVRAI